MNLLALLVVGGVIAAIYHYWSSNTRSGKVKDKTPVLRDCPSCKSSVSTMATSCPQCGHPFKKIPAKKDFWVDLNLKNGCGLGCLGFMLLVVFSHNFGDGCATDSPSANPRNQNATPVNIDATLVEKERNGFGLWLHYAVPDSTPDGVLERFAVQEAGKHQGKVFVNIYNSRSLSGDSLIGTLQGGSYCVTRLRPRTEKKTTPVKEKSKRSSIPSQEFEEDAEKRSRRSSRRKKRHVVLSSERPPEAEVPVKPKPEVKMPPVKPKLVDCALIKYGASVRSTGTPVKPNLNDVKMLDGISNKRMNFSGYTIPCEHIVDLGRTRTVSAIRLHLWDEDDRKYKFILQMSTNKRTWYMVANRTGRGVQGVQNFNIGGKRIRYLRIQGLGNTENKWFHVKELMVYVKVYPKESAR